ncbi:MAG: hypothetical protein MI919_29650, partial [Holophagales bacterium]|nr:hypothetical protein [Holophagales bacterium]
MSRSSYRSGHERSRRGRRFLLLLLLALLLGTAYWLRPGPKAEIRIEPALPAVGPSTSISLEVREPSRGLTSVQVEILQGEHSWTISSFDRAERSAWTPWGAKITTHETTFEVGRENQRELGPGEVVVRVLAIGDGPWLRSRTAAETRLPVDLEAPALVPLTESATVRQGGSGALVYSAGEDAARHGVRVGDVEVEGVPLPADPDSDQPPATGSRQHFVLYGVPFDLS